MERALLGNNKSHNFKQEQWLQLGNYTQRKNWSKPQYHVRYSLEYDRENISHKLSNQLRIPRPDDWCHPLIPQLNKQVIGLVPQDRQREDQDIPGFDISSCGA